jgi:hypothetical protein
MSTPALDRALEELQLSDSGLPPAGIDLLLNRWYSDRERTVALRRMLLHCLRNLQPEHAALVSAEHRKELYFELKRKRNDPYLVCAILKALMQIEDHTPVYDVIQLASGSRSAAEFPQIQAAAHEYLIKLNYLE